jgi:DNA-binding MarR family transcriptional regulator
MEDLKQLFSDLVRFETELWNAVDARLRAEHDLPLHKFEPMQIVSYTPDCRVYDIAEALSLTTGGVSKIVDSIEASGWVKRRPNPEDRRSSIIELTPAGKKLLSKATSTFEAELAERLGGALSHQALRQFTSALTGLRAAGGGVRASKAPFRLRPPVAAEVELLERKPKT